VFWILQQIRVIWQSTSCKNTDHNKGVTQHSESIPRTALSGWLSRLPAPAFALFAAFAAFSCYFSMYAFRKPFTAAAFDGMSFAGSDLQLKTAFVLSQIIGYTLSKYIGVKVCSETTRGNRAGMLIKLILASLLALVLFAVLPGSWKVAAMFLNGLPLGMVWGLVVAYLEGRRCSDVVMAALCGSFIVASAAVKDVGRWLMSGWQVPEIWMPAATGALFLPVFLLAVYLLSCLAGAGCARQGSAQTPRGDGQGGSSCLPAEICLGHGAAAGVLFLPNSLSGFPGQLWRGNLPQSRLRGGSNGALHALRDSGGSGVSGRTGPAQWHPQQPPRAAADLWLHDAWDGDLGGEPRSPCRRAASRDSPG
jgi:hypothetical protein